MMTDETEIDNKIVSFTEKAAARKQHKAKPEEKAPTGDLPFEDFESEVMNLYAHSLFVCSQHPCEDCGMKAADAIKLALLKLLNPYSVLDVVEEDFYDFGDD